MPEQQRWQLCDVFCGGGLFSHGAMAAGMEVASAVDCSADALVVYKLNQKPQTEVACATVGPDKTEFAFPPPRPNLHVHLSLCHLDIFQDHHGWVEDSCYI